MIISIPLDKRALPMAMLLLVSGFILISLSLFLAGSILLVILAGHLAFFRDPERSIPAGESPLSPADGKVVEISTQIETRYLGEESIRIRIFLSIFDAHINRAPLAGRVEYMDYVPGKFFNALRKDSNLYNESNWIGVKGPKHRVLVRQIAGTLARRICCDVKRHEEIRRGQKIGIICYGSGMELFFSKRSFRPTVKAGDRLKAGESILGDWIS